MFSYLVSADKFSAAWYYAAWKYSISTADLSSISYDPNQSVHGLTFEITKTMSLGPGAFSDEWVCASVLGHENVHGGQVDFMLEDPAEQEATTWELEHSNAPRADCKLSPLTYIYDYCIDYYDDCKTYYSNHGGEVVYP